MTSTPDATETAVHSRAEPDIAQRARHRIARRLLPFLFLLYVIAFLDRMNVGAAALQMPHDLGFSEGVIGFGAGIFFLGYFLLEIPGALIVERWGARRWISRIMITWGMMTVLMAFIHTSRQFYIVRFLVGAAEAGFLPGVIVYLTYWFRYQDRAKAVAFFYAANPLSYVIGSPLAGIAAGALVARNERLAMVVHHRRNSGSGRGSNHSLVFDGLAASGRLASCRRKIVDYHRVAAGEGSQEASPFLQCVAGAAPSGRDLADRMCYFCAMTGSYGIAFWLPTILKRLSGKSDLKVTLLAALPYVAAFIAQQVNGWHSDRTRERRWHAAIPVFLCGVALALAVVYSTNLPVSIGLFVVAGGSFYGFQPVFWAVPTMFLSESAAAASIGLINSVGNLGGFVGPMVMGYLAHRTHSFSAGLLYLVASLFVSGGLMLVVGRQVPEGHVSPS